MKRGVHLFVGNIHVEAILEQKLGALGWVFLVGSEFVTFPTSFGAKNRIVKGCSSLGVGGLEHNAWTFHQKGDNFYQSKIACLRQGGSTKWGLIVDITALLVEVLDGVHIAIGADKVEGCAVVDIARLKVHFDLFDQIFN